MGDAAYKQLMELVEAANQRVVDSFADAYVRVLTDAPPVANAPGFKRYICWDIAKAVADET